MKPKKMRKETYEKLCAALRAFTSCTPADSLLETMLKAAKTASAGDGISLSPACSSFDLFQDFQQRGVRIYPLMKSISWGRLAGRPKMHGETAAAWNRLDCRSRNENFSPRGFLRENHGANEPIKSTSQKGRREAS